MQLQEIQVTIDNSGQVELAVQGVPGGGCLELTRQLEEILGGKVVQRRMTSESADGGAAGMILEDRHEEQLRQRPGT